MTKNTKNFADARAALVKLASQVSTEAKADPRLARAKKRTEKLVSALDMALKKYELVYSRKVPAKVKQRKAKAGVAKKIAKRKERETAEVIQLKPATAAARKKAAVKRSAKR